jgi:hypothetical protein
MQQRENRRDKETIIKQGSGRMEQGDLSRNRNLTPQFLTIEGAFISP